MIEAIKKQFFAAAALIASAFLIVAIVAPAHAQFAEQRTEASAVSGTNAIALTVANYTAVTKIPLRFKAVNSNTGAVTVVVNSLTSQAVKKQTTAGLAALVGGEIVAGQEYIIEWDGTQYQLLGIGQQISLAANTYLGNSTSSAAVATAQSWPSCPSGSGFINYVLGTGTSCGSLAGPDTINANPSGPYTVCYAAESGCGGLSDCQKIIEVNGAQIDIILPAATNFPAGCVITLINYSTTRAQEISGAWPDPRISGSTLGVTNFCGSSCLWPSQTIIVQSNASVWILKTLAPQRYITTAFQNIYVGCSSSVSGGTCNTPVTCSDANDGLSTSAMMCTIQQALTAISSQMDYQGTNPHIILNPAASGENDYTGGFVIAGQSAHRGDGISICGTSCTIGSGTPLAARILPAGACTPSAPNACQSASAYDTGVMFLTNLGIACNISGGIGVYAYQNATAELNDVTMAACQAYPFEATYGGHINIDQGIVLSNTVSPIAYFFVDGPNAAILTYGTANVISCTSAASTTTAFLLLKNQGQISMTNESFSGCSTSTGGQYNASGISLIDSGGHSSTSYFPGNSGSNTLTPGSNSVFQ